MADRALHLPGSVLGRISLDARRGRRVVASIGIVDGKRLAAVIGSLREAATGNVAVPLQDFFRCHFGILFEEAGIAEDGLEILRDLWKHTSASSP
jgi:hypothetical protein